jgi:hypothetical protein
MRTSSTTMMRIRPNTLLFLVFACTSAMITFLP